MTDPQLLAIQVKIDEALALLLDSKIGSTKQTAANLSLKTFQALYDKRKAVLEAESKKKDIAHVRKSVEEKKESRKKFKVVFGPGSQVEKRNRGYVKVADRKKNEAQ